MAPKEKIITSYIDMEFELGEVERVRKLCEKYIEKFPKICRSWVKYAEIEIRLFETERVRAIYELGITQPLDYPE